MQILEELYWFHVSHFHSRTFFGFYDALTLLLTKLCVCKHTKAVFTGDESKRSAVIPLHVKLADVIDCLNSSSRSGGNRGPRVFHAN